MFAVVLGLLSALASGASQILVRKNLEKSSYLNVSLTVTIMGNIILWPIALGFSDLNNINPEGLLLFAVAGLLAPGIARLLYFKGMKNIGISANSSIFSTYPIYTSIIAVCVLGETLTPENWIGLTCIVAGVIFIGKTTNNTQKNKHTTKKALIVPVLGSLTIAFSQIVRKEGLNIYNQPLLGLAVGYATTLIVYLAVIAFSKTAATSKFSQKDLKLFWKPGLGIAIGWLLAFLALSQEMVSIVVPVLQTELLFILLFSYIFLRKLEKFSFTLVISALLVIAGVILISIN